MESRPKVMLTRLEVQNYRSLADIELEFSPLTVLVGRNGSGKSNIIDVLRFVADALTLGLDNAIGKRDGIRALRRWSPKGRPYDVVIRLKIEAAEWRATFALELGSQSGGEYFIKREACVVEGETTNQYEIRNGKWITHPDIDAIRQYAEVTSEIEEQIMKIPSTRLYLSQALAPEFLMVGWVLRGIGVYNILPEKIRRPLKPANPQPLAEDGSNISSTLRFLKRERRPNWDKIREFIGLITPGITDISVQEVGGYLVTRLHHGETGPAFPLAQESDGTLRALGMLTSLYQDPPRTLVAIEEPELNIHPGALATLCGIFLQVSQTTQVVLTTHSPDFLERIPTESLRVVEMDERGVTGVGPLMPYQIEAVRQNLFTPGELLRIEGLRRAPVDVTSGV